jgi:hypothetical protein
MRCEHLLGCRDAEAKADDVGLGAGSERCPVQSVVPVHMALPDWEVANLLEGLAHSDLSLTRGSAA